MFIPQNVSALGLSEDLFLPTVAANTMTITAGSAATVAANTITPGGATGSGASPATVAVASVAQGPSRAPATEGELQSVPPAPETFPSIFYACPRCGGVRARWEIAPRTNRPWFRCHGFPTSCSFACSRTI